MPMVSPDGAADLLSSSNSYKKYLPHLSPGQERFEAILNLANSYLSLPFLRNRRSGGKFVVLKFGEAYDAQVSGQNRKFRLKWNYTQAGCSFRCSLT
jgi:hypothetical protein